MNDLCTACLCTGRTLRYIGETGFYHIYSQILSEISVYDLSQICIRICWECRAALRRLQEFKLQVKSCYSELLQHVHQGEQDTKLLEKAPHLQSKQVISIDYPDIKTEYDSLDINFDGQHSQEISPPLDQPLDQNYVQPIIQDYDQQNQIEAKELDRFVKEEDHNELKTFVNDFNVKKNVKKKKPSKVDKVKTAKVKKKKPKLKKTSKIKKKPKKSVENEIKSDADSCHNFEDNYLSPLEDNEVEKEGIDKKEQKLEDLDSKVCDIYQKNEVPVEFENAECRFVKESPEIAPAQQQQKQQQKRQQQQKQPMGAEKPQCAECGKVFSSRKTLRYHLNVLHAGNNRYPCPRCGKVYQWKSNLGRHLRSHKARDTGELYCETCDKRFASVATYRQHLSISKQHVSESQFSFTCNECGKKFVNKTRLRDHIDWEHLQKIKFRCQLCNKPFKCHTSLYVHMKNVHRNKGLKDNLCHVCGKSYQNAAKLRYHIVAMHTTQTPYQCEQCTAAFGWYSSLYRHVREVHYKMKMHGSKAKKGKKPHTHTHSLPHTDAHALAHTHMLPPPIAP